MVVLGLAAGRGSKQDPLSEWQLHMFVHVHD